MTHETCFHREILANPSDPAPRLVWADWLEEQGDPRAELLRLQEELRGIDVVGRQLKEARLQSLLRQNIEPPAVTLTNSLEMPLVLVFPGEFLMGPRDHDAHRRWEGPQHCVTIAEPLLLGQFPVTNREYEQLMEVNPSRYRELSRPVERVTWFEAARFCNRLSQREGLACYYELDGPSVKILGGTGYRLPTEAEWEYACRGGTTSRWHFGDDDSILPRYGWSRGKQTHPVGGKRPNAWGLYDLVGNVRQWCNDWYEDVPGFDLDLDEDANANEPLQDIFAVARGSSHNTRPSEARSTSRMLVQLGERWAGIGFRVARRYKPGGGDLPS